ncbi:concanavalin A-like lectin/glucanase domain-containing protein [Globomyces pollinis-pini]|nr:concanavalin A-like lectin/glucanase domain-containing protein [Globomyces pollinis-pini]
MTRTLEQPIRVSYTQSIPSYLSQPNEIEKTVDILPKFCELNSKSSPNPNKPLNLPSCWSLKNRNQNIELEPGNLTVEYQGIGKTEADVVSIKGNLAIPRHVGVYYYEVTIVSKGRDGYFGVGFTTNPISSNKQPGLEDLSWGYHGADGKKYCISNKGTSYGPSYTTGDTIGCCINFSEMSISFTKNGIFLGVAFTNILSKDKDSNLIFPCIGLRTQGEILKANFGREPFKFDINQFYQDERQKLLNSIYTTSLDQVKPSPKFPDCTILNELIIAWMISSGYHDSAKALYESTIAQSNKLDQIEHSFNDLIQNDNIVQRKTIQHQILSGQVKEAVHTIESNFANFKQSFPIVYLQLKCLEFIEMIKQLFEHKNDSQHMELDQQLTLKHLVQFGKSLRADYNHTNQNCLEAIEEICSLICYTDPFTSPLSYLLSPQIRQVIADSVNTALLKNQQLDPVSPLEKLFRHSLVLDQLLSENSGGSASLLDYQNSFFKQS